VDQSQENPTNMATYQVIAPEQFMFSKPEEWQRWVQRFQRFRQASVLSEKEEETQVNTLIYTMGSVAEDILASLKMTADDKKKYENVLKKLNDYFVRRNTIYLLNIVVMVFYTMR